MRLQLTDFGRIRSADLDIRPLTVFVGDNGTNKSWAAYALHGLLRMMSRQVGSSGKFAIQDETIAAAVSAMVGRAADNLEPTIQTFDIEFASSTGRGTDRNGLALFLGLDSELLSASAGASLRYQPAEMPDHLTRVVLEYSPTQQVMVATGTNSSGRQVQSRYVGWKSAKELAGHIIYFATTGLDRVVVLPAERKAFTGIADFDRALDSIRGGNPNRMPLAWLDFADMLHDAMRASGQTGPIAGLAAQFAAMTGGALIADRNTLAFQVEHGPVLPMHGAASLVRAVAGLDLYLSRLARRGDVVIIDELEMNAHPGAQLALVELVAMMVHAGLRVVFTTHSPYILDHLNNLMAASRVARDAQGDLAKQFALQAPQAFISPEDVAAYRFKNSEANDSVDVIDVLERQTARVSWTTFTEVSDRLSRLYDAVDQAAMHNPPKPKSAPAKARKASRGSSAG